MISRALQFNLRGCQKIAGPEHFMFVFIHPYMDENGRMGRFILNAMLASGGYPWTVVPLESREEYMKALEKASAYSDISDFTKVIATLVSTNNK